MIERLQRWYPFFFAPLPILNLLTRNPGGTRLEDAGVVLAVALLGCAVVYLVLAVLFGRRLSPRIIPLLVFLIIVLFYSKSFVGYLSRDLGLSHPAITLVVLLGLVGFGIWLVVTRPELLNRVNTFLGLTGLLLLSWLGFRFVAGWLRGESSIEESLLVKQLQTPIRSDPSRANPKRDIYLIVLDEYAHSTVLKEQFQFDNRSFEESLRSLGFTIPVLVRSNYVHTVLSLPSLLNFSHLTALTEETGARSTDATLPNYLLEHNRTATFLRERGYRILFFPSQWWPSTRHSQLADWEFEPWAGFHLERDATRSDLRRSLLSTTAVGLLGRPQAWDADYVRRTLEALAQVPDRPVPTFAFAHVMSPHWPYVFQGDCRIARDIPMTGRMVRKQAYTDQLQCLNRLLLDTITAILQRSSPPPIIILQGDHGTNLLRYSDARTAESVSPAQARERFGTFGAYYLPEGGGRLFRDTVTVVNVMQKVLGYYFDAEIESSPDELYMSLERTPYLFARVDPATLKTHSTETKRQ
jgi:hypothetical protein